MSHNRPQNDGRLYCDHAATSFPKPPGVIEAVVEYMTHNGSSAGRGAYREAVESGQMVAATRNAIRKLFNARPADHVIFTLNGTDALNLGIKSLIEPGDHVVTTSMDHNSVLRPLSALQSRQGVEWTAVEADSQTTLINPADIAAALRSNTKLVIVSHASNITGAIQPIAEIAEICRAKRVLYLVDAAQSAGHVPIDFGKLPIDLLAMPGHKGLQGPSGTGVLLIRAGVETHMKTVREGGTGSASEHPIQPTALPDRFEPGCHNGAGLAGLLAAVNWLLQQGVENLRRHELELIGRFMTQLGACKGLTSYGPREPAQRTGVFTLRIEGFEPAELSIILESQYGVLSRSGLHCAPFAHRTLGTDRLGGSTRLSFGPLMTAADVDRVGRALTEIAYNLVGSS